MAKHDPTSQPQPATTQARHYTVGYIWDALAAKPSITLKGGWLADAGFDTGTPVNVRVLQGCLIITVQEPEQEPEVMQTLRKVCKLSARKQRQIAEFIQVIATPQKRAARKG